MLPDFIADDLPFPIFGIVWMVVGLGLSIAMSESRHPVSRRGCRLARTGAFFAEGNQT
jgi:hypothetical protein